MKGELLRPDQLDHAAQYLKDGQLVAIPTETVYGLAVDPFSVERVAKVFEAKDRPRFDPLIVHLPKRKDWISYTSQAGITGSLSPKQKEKARALTQAFWPGPLTLVLPRGVRIPEIVTGGLKSVGIRCPAHPLTLRLLEMTGPLAAPSANPFSGVSPTTAQHVLDSLAEKITAVLDGGPCWVGLESTVIEIDRDGELSCLRQGGLDLDKISQHSDQKIELKASHASPGHSPKHYAPRKPTFFLGSKKVTEDDAVLLFTEKSKKDLPDQVRIRVLSNKGDPVEAARNLFKMMRELEGSKARAIFLEKAPGDKGLYAAINDRLERAVGK